MLFVQILICILIVYFIFHIGPSVFIFNSIFFSTRRKCKKAKLKDYYKSNAETIENATSKLNALQSKEISIKADDGVILKADYFDGGNNKTAIMLHGYCGSPLTNCSYLGSYLWDNGYNLLLVHLRSHGKSGGKCSTMGLYEYRDLLHWISWASSNKATDSIIVYGVSMGGSTVAFASDKITDPKVKSLIIDCGFTSFYQQLRVDAKRLHIPHRMVLPIIGFMYKLAFKGDYKASTTHSLSKNKIPALFIHGDNDESVPFEHGQQNYAFCASQKDYIFVPDATHTCALITGKKVALDKVLSFITTYIN